MQRSCEALFYKAPQRQVQAETTHGYFHPSGCGCGRVYTAVTGIRSLCLFLYDVV